VKRFVEWLAVALVLALLVVVVGLLAWSEWPASQRSNGHGNNLRRPLEHLIAASSAINPQA
jgi:hypothetical protein